MAQIDPPLLPPRLFRYRDVSSAELAERELDAIANNYLWCSRYGDLNDPMEGIYGASPWLASQTAFEILSREILNNKRSVGICCFSDNHDNELMWSHYTRNYSGICVAYSTRQLREGLGDEVHLVRVAYDGRPPRIGKDYQEQPQQAAKTVLSHKKSCWLYEREWRLLTSPAAIQVPGPLHIASTGSTKAVYLGPRMNNDIKAKMISSLTKLNVDIHTLQVSGYEHKWTRLKKPSSRS